MKVLYVLHACPASCQAYGLTYARDLRTERQVVRALAQEILGRGWHPINRNDGDESSTQKQIQGWGRSWSATTCLVG